MSVSKPIINSKNLIFLIITRYYSSAVCSKFSKISKPLLCTKECDHVTKSQKASLISRLHTSETCYKPEYGPREVERSMMMNGIRVASAKTTGAFMAACTIMFQAGSRFESDDQLGATHFIRTASNASGDMYTAFSKTRVLQQRGAAITCASNRQFVSFTLRCPTTEFPYLKYYLLDTACRNCYSHWELDERRDIMYDDLDRMDPGKRVIDLVQRACWSGPLSNSVFCEEERIGSMTEDSLNCFVDRHFKPNVCTIGSFGVPFEETMKIAEKVEILPEKPAPCACDTSRPRGGFEYYDLGPGSDTWIALAIPGTDTSDLCCVLKHAIVAAACGTGDLSIGSHVTDRVPQPPLPSIADNDMFTSYRAFNLSYADNGMFGVMAKTRSCSAWQVASCAAQFLSNIGDLTFQQIETGKQRLKLSLALHDEDCTLVSAGLALQIASNHQMDSVSHAMCMVDAICIDEVAAVAKCLSSKRSQMAVAVVGDVGQVPHDRQLVPQ